MDFKIGFNFSSNKQSIVTFRFWGVRLVRAHFHKLRHHFSLFIFQGEALELIQIDCDGQTPTPTPEWHRCSSSVQTGAGPDETRVGHSSQCDRTYTHHQHCSTTRRSEQNKPRHTHWPSSDRGNPRRSWIIYRRRIPFRTRHRSSSGWKRQSGVRRCDAVRIARERLPNCTVYPWPRTCDMAVTNCIPPPPQKSVWNNVLQQCFTYTTHTDEILNCDFLTN